MEKLVAIINKFDFKGDFVNFSKINIGHINDTFKLNFSSSNNRLKSYILQKINTTVFKHPFELMSNVQEVSSHLAFKIKGKKKTLQIVRTKKDELFLNLKHDDCWRAYEYIGNTTSYQKVTSIDQMYKAGLAIADFHQSLSDFPIENLKITIKDFHNSKLIYDQFLNDFQSDENGKSNEVLKESLFFEERKKYFGIYHSLKQQGKLPLRVCHNDTKINNILFDEKTDQPIAIIDLDTVMPGIVLNDFGDAIRSGANSAFEDENDLDKVGFNFPFYESFTKGYLGKSKEFLTKEEINWLAYSPYIITMEQGVRFLHDHINGDVYFKTSRKNHNLDRARNQIKLAHEMEQKLDKMIDIVKNTLI